MTMRSDDIAHDKTLAADGLGRDATVAADTVVPATSSSAPLQTALRTTVLPRVELIGAQSKVVADGKARYELSHRLGEGGVGEVMKARDNDIDRDVAIKQLRPEMQTSRAALLRFAEEVRTVGRLEHPNIVPIHDVGVHPNGDYFFVMKYVQGETLETIIDKLIAGDPHYHAMYDIERRVEIIMGILEAVAYAHSKKIIHRDIKPANIMVGPYGEVMVMDWGLARETNGPETVTSTGDSPDATGPRKLFKTRVGTLLGTPAYMSPEQARGDELDERSDVYSLCMTFYELLSLNHPHANVQSLEAMLEAVKSEAVPHAIMHSSVVQGRVPADLSWFLEAGLRKNKEDRFQSVNDMIARLRRRAAGDIPVQCSATFSIRVLSVARWALDRYPFIIPRVVLLGAASALALAIIEAFRLAGH